MARPQKIEWPEKARIAVGPFGAKRIGEPALVPTAPAILNAIHAATGVRLKELPATPEKVWELLKR